MLAIIKVHLIHSKIQKSRYIHLYYIIFLVTLQPYMIKPTDMYKIALTLALIAAICAYSCRSYRPAPLLSESQDTSASYGEEGAVQEPAWTYYERLSLALGCDSSSIGISSDMTLPGWYSGCFVNDNDRLTINVIGDSLQLRQMLENMLNGNEFDMGMGLYSWNEQRAVTDSLLNAVEHSPIRLNMSCGSNVDGTLDVTLEAADDSAIESFRKEVFDSPLLRFSRADRVGIILDKEEIEVQEKRPDEQSYMEYETPPQFPGGDGAMIKYIYDNLRYPQKAFDNEYQGRVAVMFHVNNDGYVDSAKVVKSKDAELDAEALRIIKSFPRFTPASVNGADTAWWMAIPVMFKITDFEARRSTHYKAYQFDNGPDYPSEGLYRIVDDNGLIGYADEQGNTVITPRFKFGFPFKDGHAKVTDSGHLEEVAGSGGEYHQWHSSDWYFIDPTGRKID